MIEIWTSVAKTRPVDTVAFLETCVANGDKRIDNIIWCRPK